MRKTIVAGICLAGIAGTALFADGKGADKKESAPRAMPKAVVAVEPVTEVADMETRRYTGQVVSKSVVQITARVSGEILEVGFQDGSPVKKGQLLYHLDPIQYEASVRSAEAKIAECKARLDYAQRNFDRNSSLYDKQAASRDTMENTKASLEALKAGLLAAEAELVVAKDNLKNTRITAPIAGLAGVTNYTLGNYVTPSSGTLVTIIQVQPARVCFSISAGDYLNMFGSFENLQKTADVRLQLADGKQYPTVGKIELLNNEANRKTDAIQVYATFPNQDYKLLIGSTVNVTLSKKQGKTMAAVPPSAVMHDSKGSFVYVVDQANKVEKRYVIAGNATADFQLIRSGVKKGERVVSQGTHKTMPGGEVVIMPAVK